MERVAIIAYDCLSPLGTDLASTWDGVVSNRSGIARINRYDSNDGIAFGSLDAIYGGQIPLSYSDLAGSAAKYEKFPEPAYHSVPLVCRSVLKEIDFCVSQHNPQRIALLSATALTSQISQESLTTGKRPYTGFILNQCHNIPMALVAKEFGIQGPSFSIGAACASGNHALFMAHHFIKAGLVDCALVAGFEFPILPITVGGLDWLHALYRRDKPEDRAYENPDKASRPFSNDRRGFLPAEGVGVVFLAAEGYAKSMGWPVKGIILGGYVNSDGDHLTRIAPGNIAACMRAAIDAAECDREDIECINAHATSTPKGDAAEMQALREVFGERLGKIPVVANKSQLGHSMGACSILELIIAVEGMNTGIVSPTLNHIRDPLLPDALVPAEAMERQHRRTLLNSFGFGGTNTSLVVGLA